MVGPNWKGRKLGLIDTKRGPNIGQEGMNVHTEITRTGGFLVTF